MNTATLGVRPSDAGVASATVNSCQQVGGSIGTAFLNTIAIAAATSFTTGKAPSKALASQAAVHGYTVAFWWAAGIFALGAVVATILLRPGVPVGAAKLQPAGAA
jgi:hypothetical protein